MLQGNPNEIGRNGDGYPDPTAYAVMINCNENKYNKDDERFYKLLHTIFAICELSGFRFEGRLTVRDVKTGKIWR